jgi:hypothetical protein
VVTGTIDYAILHFGAGLDGATYYIASAACLVAYLGGIAVESADPS